MHYRERLENRLNLIYKLYNKEKDEIEKKLSEYPKPYNVPYI
jgi:hypothetical protein